MESWCDGELLTAGRDAETGTETGCDGELLGAGWDGELGAMESYGELSVMVPES